MTVTSRAFDTVSERPTAAWLRARAVVAAVLIVGRAAAAAPDGTSSPAASATAAPVPSATAANASPNRPLAVATAVVPGLVVHGAGHYVLDEKRTARRLLLMEGVGFGLMAVGGLTVF